MNEDATFFELLIREMNDAWMQGFPDRLLQHFDDDMVIVSPDFEHRVDGKEASIQTYRDFCANSKVYSFHQDSVKVDLFEFTAVVSYRFSIEYATGGKHYRDSGRDLFVFSKKHNTWKAVWRSMTVQLSERLNEERE